MYTWIKPISENKCGKPIVPLVQKKTWDKFKGGLLLKNIITFFQYIETKMGFQTQI